MCVKTSNKGTLVIVSVCVDDLILMGNHASMFSYFKESTNKEFDMFDLGKMSHFSRS